MAYTVTDDGVITMFRGDTVALEVDMTVYNADGSVAEDNYAMSNGDKLILTVRSLPSRTSPVLFQITSSTSQILIRPEDTANVDPGEYSADIEFRKADGTVNTIFPLLQNLPSRALKTVVNWKNFIIVGEVTE